MLEGAGLGEVEGFSTREGEPFSLGSGVLYLTATKLA
jgi:hypothetical protein